MRSSGRLALAVLLVLVLVPATGCLSVSPDSADDATTAPGGQGDAETLDATVTDVVDGDTIDVRYPDGSTDTVRLLGVDTPETFGETSPAEFEDVPETEAGRECLGAVGEDASAYVTERLEGESVSLEVDPTADRRGSYGRLLAYVLHDRPNRTDANVNYHLVAEGDARVYDSTFRQSDRFYAAEADAQTARLGVWDCRDGSLDDGTGSPDGDRATDGGRAADEDTGGSERGLAVARVHEDATGDDGQNLHDEYVVFQNVGEESLDLSGWTVADEAGHSYEFPEGTSLAPGARLTLHTGSGTDSSTDLYWGSNSPVWNNDGDTVRVFDGGETVLTESYD